MQHCGGSSKSCAPQAFPTPSTPFQAQKHNVFFCIWNASFALADGATLTWDLATTAPVAMRLLDARGRTVAAHTGTAWNSSYTHHDSSSDNSMFHLRVERDYDVPVLTVRALTLDAPLYYTQRDGWPSVVGAGEIGPLARAFQYLCVEPAAPEANVSWAPVVLHRVGSAPASRTRALHRLRARLAVASIFVALAPVALAVAVVLWRRSDRALPVPVEQAQPLLSKAASE